MPDNPYDHFAELPELPKAMGKKRKTPERIAVVDEANCTGCRVCVPFCPVDCIEPVPEDKYNDTSIPPVHVRFNECIGCEICVKACEQLTWNAISMVPVPEFEQAAGVTVEGPRYGWEGVEADASIGPTAAEVYERLTAEKKIKFT